HVLTEHLISLPPTMIGFRHMEQTNAGEEDMALTVIAPAGTRKAILSLEPRANFGRCGYLVVRCACTVWPAWRSPWPCSAATAPGLPHLSPSEQAGRPAPPEAEGHPGPAVRRCPMPPPAVAAAPVGAGPMGRPAAGRRWWRPWTSPTSGRGTRCSSRW